MNLAGKRVLVTGAGHGLGRAIALEFARAGAEVIATDLDPARVAAIVTELAALGPAAGYAMDVTDPVQVGAVRDRLRAERGPLDVLVNNAGVVFGGEFLRVPLERHVNTVAVNLTGVLAVTHAFLADLIARPTAQVVNIASAAAVIALPLAASYAATKWAVLGFSESLREELRQTGLRHVRVTAVCPSYIATGLFDGAKPALLTSLLTTEVVARAVRRAVVCGTEFVLLPNSARLLYGLTGLMPRWLARRVCRGLGVSASMSSWRGHTCEVTPNSAVRS
jgi:all-trans-retinol dehydrogenase (NAD+)